MSQNSVTEDVPLLQRVRENPRPALIWGSIMALLFVLEFGAVATTVLGFISSVIAAIPGGTGASLAAAFKDASASAAQIPTLTSRELIPNQGYQESANGPWVNTFLGLEPKWAWLIRVLLTYTYAFTFLAWVLVGYKVFRDNYRYADWTPRDDVVRRMKNHRWGQFGFIIVFLFVIMAVFAPTLGPTTFDENIDRPYENQFKYFNEDTQSVQEAFVGDANLMTASRGAGSTNIQPWQYDEFGRFHPFGTMPTPGQDLFTFMVHGARVSLFIGLVSISLSTFLAAGFGLLTAYYKGLVDLATVVASDSIMSLPQLLILILLSVVFQDHWLSSIYNGGLLIALIFAGTGWPFLWRAIRGPAFQVSEQEWVDAARSYGQRSTVTMKKHMLPYILGYLLIYGSMTLGGIIIGTSALSFLGLGISPPTPEWGSAISAGQNYVTTDAWHVSLIPGLLIVLVVTAFNALGDGIRDSLDPKSGVGDDTGGEAAAAAGGGGG
ncbi:ABC transporter permease [Haladaptatus sp. CMSO5]|uniref:ABC transporter permease n=1 Tax=Haladaptatus sp. CMSO5 TaxID=3120514 RepID=UPI002FCDF048